MRTGRREGLKVRTGEITPDVGGQGPKAWRRGDCKSQEEWLWGAPGKADL